MTLFRDVMKKHPELKEDPLFNPKRYPGAFEDALLMIAEKNHLTPGRLTIDAPYGIDGCLVNADGDVVVYYELEYSNVKDLFEENSYKVRYWDISIPIEKKRTFERYYPVAYIRGNLKKVLVLGGDGILRDYKATKKLCYHGSGNKKICVEREFLSVHTRQAIKKGYLKTGPLRDWLKMVKELFPLEIAIDLNK